MSPYFNKEVCLTVSQYMAGEYEASVNQVEKFELKFLEFMGMDHCVAVSSGSAALHLALLACDVGPGDEVITIANSCTAVSDAILWCRAKPVFVDVEPETYNMNPNLLESALTSKTKAILPVHLYGHPVDMNPILEIAEKNNLLVVEDAAQAAGATYRNKLVGTFGIVGCFSFPKNLGGYGGAILTNDESISYKVDMLRHFGRPGPSSRQEILGYRYTLNNLNALVNRLQIKYLEANNEKRRQNANNYLKLLIDIPDIILPIEKTWAKHVYNRFIPRVKRKEELVKYCRRRKTRISRGYSIPVYDQGAYKKFTFNKEMFPITEKISREGISLPVNPNLEYKDIKKISDTMHMFYYE